MNIEKEIIERLNRLLKENKIYSYNIVRDNTGYMGIYVKPVKTIQYIQLSYERKN